MEGFLDWILESSLLVIMIFGIRKIFMGKIRYSAICALWLIVVLRFMIPVNLIPLPINVGHIISETVKRIDNDRVSPKEEQDIAYRNYDRVSDIGLVSVFTDELVEEDTSSIAESRRNIDWNVLLKKCMVIISIMFAVMFAASNLCMLKRIKKERKLYYSRRNMKIYTVSCVKNPCLYGLLRPAVYIPEELVSYSGGIMADSEEIEQIILHEYVHYKHKDHIWAFVRMVLISAHWFNPLLWFAMSCFKKDAELYCDETVVDILGDEKRFGYGEMLVKFAGDACRRDFRYSMVSMGKRGKEMEQRIRAISDKKHYSGWIMIPLMLIVFAAVGATCSTGAGFAAFATDVSKHADMNTRINIEEEKNHGIQDYVKNDEDPDLFKETDAGLYAPDSGLYAETYEEAFKNYIEVFTEAVNIGNTDRLAQVIDPGSEMYRQQSRIAANYYSRGIHEEIKSYEITEAKSIGADMVAIDSKERIKVGYSDGSTKVVKQKYRYTCKNVEGRWIITGMDESAHVKR